jgi:hypothetical protein
VNAPKERVLMQADDGSNVHRVATAVEAALTAVRALLDENDPLRVRAEQDLVPLLPPS